MNEPDAATHVKRGEISAADLAELMHTSFEQRGWAIDEVDDFVDRGGGVDGIRSPWLIASRV